MVNEDGRNKNPFRIAKMINYMIWVMISNSIWHIIRRQAAHSCVTLLFNSYEWICTRHSMSKIFCFAFCAALLFVRVATGEMSRTKRVIVSLSRSRVLVLVFACVISIWAIWPFCTFYCSHFSWISIHLHHDYGLIYFSAKIVSFVQTKCFASKNVPMAKRFSFPFIAKYNNKKPEAESEERGRDRKKTA